MAPAVMPLLGSKSQLKSLLKVMLPSAAPVSTGWPLTSVVIPRAFRSAVLTWRRVLWGEPSLSNPRVPAELFVKKARLEPDERLATAAASSLDDLSAVRAVRTAE